MLYFAVTSDLGQVFDSRQKNHQVSVIKTFNRSRNCLSALFKILLVWCEELRLNHLSPVNKTFWSIDVFDTSIINESM